MSAREYAFDVKLFAIVRVKAASANEARATLRVTMDYINCDAGEWPDGSPIVFEASMDDGEDCLIEIDGKPI